MTSAGSEDAAGQALAISIATPKLPPDRAERWISPIKDQDRSPDRTAEFNHRPVGLHRITTKATQAAEPTRVLVSVRVRRGRDGSYPLFVEGCWLGGGACDAQLRVTVTAFMGVRGPACSRSANAGFPGRFAARSLPNKTGMFRKTKDLRKCDRTIKDLDASCPRTCIENNRRTTKEDSLCSAWFQVHRLCGPRRDGVLLLTG